MANNTLNSRIILCSKTAADWANDTTIILNGEICIESDTRKIKIGVGTLNYSQLPYATMNPDEVQDLVDGIVAQSGHSHTNKAIIDATTASFTTELLNKLDGIEANANHTTVDTSLSSTSTNPVQNKVINSALDGKVSKTQKVNNKALSGDITLTASDVGAIAASLKGAANGVAELDENMKIPSSQLPSFVDDVIEGYYYNSKFYTTSAHTTQITAESGKIYVDMVSNKTYRWSGSTFVEISQSLALGETASTAYYGDKGATAYAHSQAAHAPTNAERNTIVGIQKNGVDVAISSDRKVNITIPTNVSAFTNDANYLISSGTIDKAKQLETQRNIDGVAFNGTASITHFGTCSTAASTAAKVVSITGFSLSTGARAMVKFTVTNTASSPTLNINNTGAVAIKYRGSAISAGYLAANRVYEFVYDGTNYELVGDLDTNTTYAADKGISLTSGKFGHTNSVTAATAKGDENKTLTFGGTLNLPSITYDAYGHVTGKSTTSVTLPAAPTTITGNAGTATKLQTARNISIVGSATAAAVSFDGSANISLNVTALNANALYQDEGDVLVLNGNF